MTRRLSPLTLRSSRGLLLLLAVLAAVMAFAAHTTSASAAGFVETRVGASDQISATGTGASAADFVDTQRGSVRSYDETAVGDLFATDSALSAQASAYDYAAELSQGGGRVPTAAAAAVDRTTGATYLGHSAELTGAPDNMAGVIPKLPGNEPWSPWNCAEVAACSKALAGGSSLDNLDVFTYHIPKGEPFAPCENCVTWVPGN